jgi:hypothetical protein
MSSYETLLAHLEMALLVLTFDFHCEMNVVFWFWGFCTVCEVNLPTMFRKPLWVPSSTCTLCKNPKTKKQQKVCV